MCQGGLVWPRKDNHLTISQTILDALDEDGNGQISKDEFVNNALEIQFINDILTLKEMPAEETDE